jgi:hypothetical protein
MAKVEIQKTTRTELRPVVIAEDEVVLRLTANEARLVASLLFNTKFSDQERFGLDPFGTGDSERLYPLLERQGYNGRDLPKFRIDLEH